MARSLRTRGTATTPSCSPADSPAHGLKHKFSISRALINSSKKLLLSLKLWRREEEDGNEKLKAYDRAVMKEEGGSRGNLLWQRSILMGERCEPPAFSGLIIYDDKGNQLPEYPPRSPNHCMFHPSPARTNHQVRCSRFNDS